MTIADLMPPVPPPEAAGPPPAREVRDASAALAIVKHPSDD